ncbi:MAG: DUF2111 domain-containing protein [Methanomassiliicoccales archaeon]
MVLYNYNLGGPTPKFSPYHVWKAYSLLRNHGPLGRKALSRALMLGEGSTRTILEKMVKEGCAENTNRGAILTEKGKKKFDNCGIIARKVDIDGIAIGKHHCGVLAKGRAHLIRMGCEQRDEAVRAGALGATTLVCRDGKVIFPDNDKYPTKEIEDALRGLFHIETGDAIIIGTAYTYETAERGAVSAALALDEQRQPCWQDSATFISQDSEAEDLKCLALAIHELVGRLPLTMRSRNHYGVRCEEGEVIDTNYTGPVLEEALKKNQIVRKISPSGPYRGVPIVAVPILKKREAVAVIGVVDITKGAVFEILNRMRKEQL